MLGLKINRTGIQPHVTKRRNLARVALTRLKRFSGMTAKTKLHLYKAMLASHLMYPLVPLNAISTSNTLRLQAIQNRALRWISGDVPPYDTTIEHLHRIYNLLPINIRIFTAAKRVWDTLRAYQEDAVARLMEEEVRGTHSWWRRSYISEEDQAPAPIYCATTLRPDEGADAEDDPADAD